MQHTWLGKLNKFLSGKPAGKAGRTGRLRLECLEMRLALSYSLSTFASFNVDKTGVGPLAGLIEDSSGNFFGTTYAGGASDAGTVFEWVKSSGTITVLATFNNANGGGPTGGLVEDSSGNLFGTTAGGGTDGDGTVFEWVKSSGTISVLANFEGSNGSDPTGVIKDSSGNLFGTTENGGASIYGTVFEWVKSSGTLSVLASFNGTNGRAPYAGVIEDSGGNLFGTTEAGGNDLGGTVFEWVKSSRTISVLATFTGATGMPSQPYGGLVEDSSGNLFGTTNTGGTNSDGTVFEWVKSSGTISVLASFTGTNGAYPEDGLIEDSSGNLFGTTYSGGTGSSDPIGFGTAFEWIKSSGAISVLADFTGTNGVEPDAGLIADSSGNLFGATTSGGTWDSGALFELVYSALPAITGPSAATFTEGAFSSFTVTDTGTPTPTLSETGLLPNGVTFNAATGVLSGTPTSTGTFSDTFTATNSAGTVGQTFTLTVNGPLVVTANDWTPAGLTLTLDGDGNLHAYKTHTTTDAVPPVALTNVTGIDITAPSGTGANLTIDSTNGNPIPADGLNYSGAGGLTITGSGTVTLSGTETYSGGTIIDEGTLVVEGNALPLDGVVTTSTGTTIEISGADTSMVGAITGAGNVVLEPKSDVTVESIDQNTLSIGAGSTFTIAPSGPGISTDSATSSSTTSTATADGSDSDSKSSSDPIAAIQAAVASGSISSVKGQRLEIRIAAIERLAATDPGLDVSRLESDVLAALPAPVAPTTKVVSPTPADSPQSTATTPTVTIAAPIVNTAATSVAPVGLAPAETVVNNSATTVATIEVAPANAVPQTSLPASTVQHVAPLLTTTTDTSSIVAVPVITTASQPTYPPQPVAAVLAYPAVDHLLEADSFSPPGDFAPPVPASNSAATVLTSGSALSAGREALLSQLFQEFGEGMLGEGIHFDGPTSVSVVENSRGDATAAGPAQASQTTSRTIFETLGLDFGGAASNGSRHASGGEIASDSITTDWSDEFLYAISAFGDSSTETD